MVDDTGKGTGLLTTASCEVIGVRYSTSKQEFAVAGRLPSEYETWLVEGVAFFPFLLPAGRQEARLGRKDAGRMAQDARCRV